MTGTSNGSVSNLTIPGTIQSGEEIYFVTSIKDDAFFRAGVETVTIPASVETIGNNAFYGETLETVTFEADSRLKSIGAGAFAGVWYQEVVDWDFEYDQPIYEDITIPQLCSINLEVCTQLETIGNEAFKYSLLSKIIIPASVTTIGTDAFAAPEQPLTVKFLGTTPPTSTANLYVDKILVPVSALETYQQALGNSVTPYYPAGYEVTEGGITYTAQADGEHFAVKKITSSAITDGALTIPNKVKDCEVFHQRRSRYGA